MQGCFLKKQKLNFDSCFDSKNNNKFGPSNQYQNLPIFP
jgi:hypothetical protein